MSNKTLLQELLKRNTQKTNKQIDQDFIEAFGQEALEELELTHKLKHLIIYLAQDLDIEPVFVAYENIEADSQLYMGDENTGPYILINRKLKYDESSTIKAIIHETRHYYHYQVMLNNLNHPLKKEWIKDLQNNSLTHPTNDEELSKHICLPIEVDAFAYTKYIMRKLYNQEIFYANEQYNRILEAYIIKYIEI